MRLELTRKTDLATRALRALDLSAPTKGSMLAHRLGTTIYYLPQVMQPLVAAGWVRSGPGPNGGYRLSPGARHTTLRQLIEAVEGPIVDGRCVHDHHSLEWIEADDAWYAKAPDSVSPMGFGITAFGEDTAAVAHAGFGGVVVRWENLFLLAREGRDPFVDHEH